MATNFLHFLQTQTVPTVTPDEILAKYQKIRDSLPRNGGQGVVLPDFNPLKNFSGVMIIGENPGDTDVQAGEHFVGPYSGLFNHELLPAAGLDRAEVYLSNVTKFNLPANRDPTEAEIASCKELTIAEIAFVKPTLVVAMGRIAAEFFLGNGIKITKIHGQFFRFQLYSNYAFDLLITVHPAAANHNPYYLNDIRADFAVLKDYLENKNELPIQEMPKSENQDTSESLF